eukprot:2640528-Prymnesium_polylepis.1
MAQLQRSLDERERSLEQRETTLRVLLGGGQAVVGDDATNSDYARAIGSARAALSASAGGADGRGELGRVLGMIVDVADEL